MKYKVTVTDLLFFIYLELSLSVAYFFNGWGKDMWFLVTTAFNVALILLGIRINNLKEQLKNK